MQAEEFRSWYEWSREGEGDNALLFGYGDPGAGKTFIRYHTVIKIILGERRGRVSANMPPC